MYWWRWVYILSKAIVCKKHGNTDGNFTTTDTSYSPSKKHSGSIPRNACVTCETWLCVTTKKMWLPDRQNRDAEQSDPYVPLCFAGDTKIEKQTLLYNLNYNCELSIGIKFWLQNWQILTDNFDVSPFNTRSKYNCLISLSNLLGKPGYIVEPPESTICL